MLGMVEHKRKHCSSINFKRHVTPCIKHGVDTQLFRFATGVGALSDSSLERVRNLWQQSRKYEHIGNAQFEMK
jgi:hypothetical protein